MCAALRLGQNEVSPRVFREQGSMAIKQLGIREQNENETGNTGTIAVFLLFQGTGITKIDKLLLGNFFG